MDYILYIMVATIISDHNPAVTDYDLTMMLSGSLGAEGRLF